MELDNSKNTVFSLNEESLVDGRSTTFCFPHYNILVTETGLTVAPKSNGYSVSFLSAKEKEKPSESFMSTSLICSSILSFCAGAVFTFHVLSKK